MIVTVVVDTPNSTLSVFFVGECNEGEASRHLLGLVLGEERANDFAERFEELL